MVPVCSTSFQLHGRPRLIHLHSAGDVPPLPFATLLSLYATLSPGLSVGNWMDAHTIDSHPVDVRRMIQFGVIKGFLRRVYAFPLWLEHASFHPVPQPSERRPSNSRTQSHEAPPLRRGRHSSSVFSLAGGVGDVSSSSYSGTTTSDGPTPQAQTPVDAPAPPQHRTAVPAGKTQPMTPQPSATEPPRPSFPSSLGRMLDGKHHTDEICIRYGIPFKHLETVLRFIGGAEGATLDAGMVGDGGQRRTPTATSYGSQVVMLYV